MASQLFLRKGTALLQPTAAPVRAFQILLNSRRLRANRPVDDPRNVAPNAEKAFKMVMGVMDMDGTNRALKQEHHVKRWKARYQDALNQPYKRRMRVMRSIVFAMHRQEDRIADLSRTHTPKLVATRGGMTTHRRFVDESGRFTFRVSAMMDEAPTAMRYGNMMKAGQLRPAIYVPDEDEELEAVEAAAREEEEEEEGGQQQGEAEEKGEEDSQSRRG